MIETIDSLELAWATDKQCSIENKIMPVLSEIGDVLKMKNL